MKIVVLGAGQLARMMSLAGAPLDLNVVAYDVRSARMVHPLTQEVFPWDLAQAIEKADVITAEFEHIPDPVLEACSPSGKFCPGTTAIKTGGDRRLEKTLLDKLAIPCAPYQLITAQEHLNQGINQLGLPLVIKTCQAGYDGKGQWRLTADSDRDQLWSQMQAFLASGSVDTPRTIIAEKMIPFQREVSVIGARDRSGKVAIYPVTENHHTNGVLTLSIAKKEAKKEAVDIQAQAEAAFFKLTSAMDYVGVLAIEFFDVQGKLMVNEIAPRVHNSGHWTQQGTLCSQFENHLRAVAGLPLGTTRMLGPSAMVNVLGETFIPTGVLMTPGVTSHWYGKACRPGRKMGHINIVAENEKALGEKLIAIAQYLPEESYPGVARHGQYLVEGV
ncbi:5-(carboxyamino)imidazole ribonucleotide synthase [Candidatus Sororendozoicomonas aggregata]|uniref:5-(carboxyamino)imidazole ribonucleotide synthase n=1 Tax=Candidatus Sororendozoicomonas aggregata TaxID=3073239 RepID=UPI002ED1D829